MTADGGDRFLGAPRFDVVLRGYDRRQVDEHIARLQRVVQRLRADLELSRAQPPGPPPPVTPGRGFRGPATPGRGVRQQPDRGQRPPQPDVVGGFTDRMQSILRAAEEEAAEIRRRARADAAGGDQLRAQVAELAGQRDAMLAELNRLRGRVDGPDGAPREEQATARPRPRPSPAPRPGAPTAAHPLEPGPPPADAPGFGPRGVADAAPRVAGDPAGPRGPEPGPAQAPGENAFGAGAAAFGSGFGPASGSGGEQPPAPSTPSGGLPSPRPRPSPVPRATVPHPTAAQLGLDGQRPGPSHSADHSGTVKVPARAAQGEDEAPAAVEPAGTDDGADRAGRTDDADRAGRTDDADRADRTDDADRADVGAERTVAVQAVRPRPRPAPVEDAGPADDTDTPDTPADEADGADAEDTVVTSAVRPAAERGDGQDEPDEADAAGAPPSNGSNGHRDAGRATSGFRTG